jgi:hypothetical protein
MSKDKISQYSTTNALNTDIGGIDIDENCLPSNLNDSVREVMVQLKEFQDGSSADSFTTANIIATGGSVNGATVGASTASTGAFTTLGATGTSTLAAVNATTVTLGGTNGLTFNDSTKMGSANSLGMRNRIINGDMRIDQRNAGTAVTVTASNTFGVDRMFSQNLTGTGVITTQQSTLGGVKSLKVTATTAVTALTTDLFVRGVEQRLEAQNVHDLNGKTITVSFRVETNWSGNLPISFLNSDSSRSYVVDRPVVSGVNNIAITLPLESTTVLVNTNASGFTVSIGFNNEATFRTATTGSWLAGSFYVSTTSTQWAKTTGNFINITDLQLEEGSVATPFERRPIGVELALCQRYYQHYITPPLRGVVGTTTVLNRMGMILPVAMRVPATIIVGALPVYDGNVTTTVSSVGTIYGTATSIEFDFNLAGSLTQYRPAMIYTSGTATVTLSSEL